MCADPGAACGHLAPVSADERMAVKPAASGPRTRNPQVHADARPPALCLPRSSAPRIFRSPTTVQCLVCNRHSVGTCKLACPCIHTLVH